jgi:hypothetical protein
MTLKYCRETVINKGIADVTRFELDTGGRVGGLFSWLGR